RAVRDAAVAILAAVTVRATPRGVATVRAAGAARGLHVGRHRRDRLVRLARLPTQVEQPGPDLVPPGLGARQPGPGGQLALLGPPATHAGRAETPGELQDDPLRALAADAGDPGQRGDVLRGDRAAQRVRGEHGQ